MPLYEYKCVKCGHRFERIEKLSAPTTQKCPKCGKKAERQLSSPAIQFKGSGWYVTDYARNSGRVPSKTAESASNSDKKTSSDTAAKTESKAETKTESKPASSDKTA